MSTRPAEITTPYGWAELLDAVRATREAIRDMYAAATWITTQADKYREQRDGTKPAERSEPSQKPEISADAVMSALQAFIDARIQLQLDRRTGQEPTESSELATSTEAGKQPEKKAEPMHPDEQQRRNDLVVEEQERQQRDLQSDGVLDGDENPEPGDGGTADAEPDLEG